MSIDDTYPLVPLLRIHGHPLLLKMRLQLQTYHLPSTFELFPSESFLCRRIRRRIRHIVNDASLDGTICGCRRD